jgi:hypothetical protein
MQCAGDVIVGHSVVLFILGTSGEKAIFMLLSLPYAMPCPANASLEKEKNTTSASKAAGLLAVTARKREIMTPLHRLAHSRRREQETRHAASSHLCHHPSGEDCSHHSKPVSSQQKEACTRRD